MPTVSATDFWDFNRPRARLTLGPLTAMVDVEHPQHGLSELRMAGRTLAGLRPLGVYAPGLPVTGPEAILDAYTRGRDLVVTYAQSPDRSVQPQIYWRAVSLPTRGGEAVGVELIFSMQTSLLESCPQASVASRLPEGRVRRILEIDPPRIVEAAAGEARPEEGSGLFLLQAAEGDWHFAAMIDPSDFVSATLSADDEGQILRYQLFPDGLEKGVIRRARLMGLLLPAGAARAEVLAAECYRQFTAEPLPLSS